MQDVSSATAVHQNLQGAVLPSSGRGGMRIQYPSIQYEYSQSYQQFINGDFTKLYALKCLYENIYLENYLTKNLPSAIFP